MIALPDLAPGRPPCSQAERAGAEMLAAHMDRLRVPSRIEPVRAPTSPAWVPLVRALCRVWSVALLAAYRPIPAIALAAFAVAAGWPLVGYLLQRVPFIGAVSQNVVGRIRGVDPGLRPVLAVAHLDTHPIAASPMSTSHAAVGVLLGWLALAAAIVGRPGVAVWRVSTAIIAIEALITLAWLARRELQTSTEMPDDNTSGLLALVSLTKMAAADRPLRDLWIVGSGAGTTGGQGITALLRSHPDLRRAWVIEIDALGAGEVVAAPWPSLFPRPGTPSALVRAVVVAAHGTGDPLAVRRVRRPHSDARAALRLRTGAITLTAGLRPPAGDPGPDPANAERIAQIVSRLAQSDV